MKCILFLLILAVLRVDGITDFENITPKKLCPVADGLISQYCDDYSKSLSCKKLEIFVKDYCNDPEKSNISFNPKDLCPIVNLFDKLLCGQWELNGKTPFKYSTKFYKFDPEELCPLFNYLDHKFCEQQDRFPVKDDQEFTCVLACKQINSSNV